MRYAKTSYYSNIKYMEKNILPEAKELIEEIGEAIEPEFKPQPNFNKKLLIGFLIIVTLILISLAFFLIKNLVSSIEPLIQLMK